MAFRGALLIFFLLGITIDAQSTAYQYFKPVEDFESQKFLTEALIAIEKNYGELHFPVKQVHIRQSEFREDPELVSLLDVKDWELFQKHFKEIVSKNELPTLLSFFTDHEKSQIVKKESLSRESKLKLVDSLNSFIKSDAYENPEFRKFITTSEEKKWAGYGFWGCFTEDELRINRRLVSKVFKGTLVEFKKIKGIREGNQSCEVHDLKNGIFIIYVQNEPGTDEFYNELGHEVFHLINPLCHDWFVEGLASLFSEEFVTSKGIKWDLWKERFDEEKFEKPYAASYHMVKELKSLRFNIFAGASKYIIKKKTGDGFYFDIQKWFNALDVKEKDKAGEILRKYVPTLKGFRKNHILSLKKY